MAEPTVHPYTRRLYDGLPEFYRDTDPATGGDNDRPLLRFLSLIGDQAGAVEDLVDRLDPDLGDGSDLLDPWTADPAWLPFVAQLRGVAFLPAELPVDTQRAVIADAVGGLRAGTRAAIANAARAALDDPAGYVNVRPHAGGDPHVIGVSVDPEFAPADLDTIVAAIDAAHARPAGIRILVDLYAATWATLETVRDTWAGFNAVTSWSRLEGTDPV